jgi:Tfp pilus assembly protein PilF
MATLWQAATHSMSTVVLLVCALALTGCQSRSRNTFPPVLVSAAEFELKCGQGSLAQGDFDNAERRFKWATHCSSTCAAAQAGLGQVAEKREQLEIAAEHYRAAMKAAQGDSQYAVALGDCLQRSAATSLERGALLESAVRAYRHALTLAPNDGAALTGLAQCYRQSGDIDQAVEALREALRADASNLRTHLMLASIFEGSHQLEAAVDEYKAALSVNPDDANIHNHLAALHLVLSKNGLQKPPLARERAIAHYLRSLQLNADQPKVRRALAKLQRVERDAVTVVESEE